MKLSIDEFLRYGNPDILFLGALNYKIEKMGKFCQIYAYFDAIQISIPMFLLYNSKEAGFFRSSWTCTGVSYLLIG